MKYFVLGAFSSAVFLYGIALVYGATGTTSLSGIATFVANVSLVDAGTLLAGLMLLLVGLGFKIAAVPFHMWTPDVYEGSPTPITAFMSSATKAAGFAALLRVLLTAFGTYRTDWRPAIWALAILTLLVGSIVALVQTDIKRMLAYSSISHAGYVLIGLEAGTRQGLRAALFYLFVYTFMNFGAFAVVIFLETRGYAAETVSDFSGLAKRNMPAAIVMLIFLLSLAGIPPTAGFIGKYYLFTAAMKAGYAWLAVLAVLASAVSLFYYFRIAAAMFFSEGQGAKLQSSFSLTAAVAICAAGTLAVGIAPERILAVLRHCVPGTY